MKYKATLRTESVDAENVCRALSVDNIKKERLSIKSFCEGDKIVSVVESDSLGAIINTLDDLLSCQMAAEKLINKK